MIDNVILAKRCGVGGGGGRRQCAFSCEAGVARDSVGWGATARGRGSNIYRVSERDREKESGAYSCSVHSEGGCSLVGDAYVQANGFLCKCG